MVVKAKEDLPESTSKMMHAGTGYHMTYVIQSLDAVLLLFFK